MLISSISSSIPNESLIFSRVSLMIDSVFKPKKSILIRPVSSITFPSYWVQWSSSPVSLSFAVETGTQSEILSLQMIKPQAWTPVLRTLPSSILAYLIVSRNNGSVEASASRSSGMAAIALGRFILGTFPSGPSGNLSGISLHKAFDVFNGSFCTRATSLIANFVAIVP